MEMTVRKARILADKTQQFMADALGISKSTYIRIERNPETATIAQAKIISRIVAMPIDDIFYSHNST